MEDLGKPQGIQACVEYSVELPNANLCYLVLSV